MTEPLEYQTSNIYRGERALFTMTAEPPEVPTWPRDYKQFIAVKHYVYWFDHYDPETLLYVYKLVAEDLS